MIDLRWEGDVAVIAMDAGENRFDLDAALEWHRALDEVEGREGPCALVTTGTGKFYSNGLDLEWLMDPDHDGQEFLRQLFAVWARVLELPAITVAAVNGHAFGAGALLSAAHDRIVMREDRGYWCMPEVDLGLAVGEPMLALLLARLPGPTVHEALVTGRRYAGPDAERAGIAAEVAPEGAVLDIALAHAAALAGKDREVVGTHKRLLHGATLRVLRGEA